MSQTKLNTLHTLPAHIAYGQQLNTHISHNLSNSCGQSMSVSELLELGDLDFEHLDLSYAPVQGDVQLRHAIAHFHRELNPQQDLMHGYQFNSENVVTFCGAQEAIAAIYKSLLLPGDEVVVFTPNYPSLTTMAEALGAKVRAISLHENLDWKFNYDELVTVVNEKTKIIVLNSPHNPTGAVCETDLANKILALAEKYQCFILADDVSQASNYHNFPIAHHYLSYNNTVAISVLSKSFGLGGVRVGWAVTPNQQLLEKLLAIKSYGSICCSKIDEQLAIVALNNQDKIVQKNNQVVLANIKLFQQFIDDHHGKFSWVPPKAGMLAIVTSNISVSCEQWLPQLAHQTGVLLLPTALFGLNGEHFRLGLGQQDFAEGLSKLASFIADNKY